MTKRRNFVTKKDGGQTETLMLLLQLLLPLVTLRNYKAVPTFQSTFSICYLIFSSWQPCKLSRTAVESLGLPDPQRTSGQSRKRLAWDHTAQ